MARNLWLACALLLALTPAAQADGLFGGGAARRMEAMTREMQRHNFAIERDRSAMQARLILPAKMSWLGAKRRETGPHGNLPMCIAMACCFGVGGLWLARLPRRALACAFLPLAMVAIIVPVHANAPPPRELMLSQPKTTSLYAGRVDVVIDEQGDHVRLILPGKPQ